MTDLRKAAEMALEALESVYGKGNRCEAAIKALRQALAEPANSTTGFVEPVAWIEKDKDYLAVSADPFENAIPVYTAPPKRNCDNCESLRRATWDRINELEAKLEEREWVGLTDNEARMFYEKYTNREELIYAIDKFLEEKNGG